jgi:osmotically-inducible protein OsmY
MRLRSLAQILLTLLCIVPISGCAPLVIGALGGAAYMTASVVTDRRTAGTLVEDNSIENQAEAAFRDDIEIDEKAHINVTAYNLSVLLTGEAPTESIRRRAEELVANIPRVRQVHNELRLAAPSDFMARSGDLLITSRVKTSLLTLEIEGFDPSKIKIVTEDSTVYLLGLLTGPEADAVVERVRRVNGVQRVVKVFEIIDSAPENAATQRHTAMS